MNEHTQHLVNGAIGVTASASGVAISFCPQLEAWMRVTSLAVGIAVGLVTLWKLLRKKKK